MGNRRIHIILGSILLGILLWLSVNLREQYQVTIDAPLSIDGIPEGMAIRTPVPAVLQLKFRGDGWRLAALMIGAEPHLHVALNTLPPDNRIITINDVLDRIPLSPEVRLIDINPDTVSIVLDRKSEKKVPVIPDISVAFRDGYGQVGPMMVSPESVTVYGAGAILDQIAALHTATVRFDDVKNQLDENVSMARSADHLLECSPASVRIRVNVQPFAEKVFGGLPVEIRDLPSNRDVIFIPPKVEIVARGGIRQLASILPVDFQVSVEYARILVDTTGYIDPSVASPPGVQVVARHPEKLQYIVRKRL
jgi:YbbR domain-containing protein